MSHPQERRVVTVHTLGTDFRRCTSIVSQPLPETLGPRQALVRIDYAGVNASDINYSNGKYLPGKRPPLEAGFEGRQRYPDVAEEIGKPVMSLTKQFEKGVGEVVAVGSEVKRPSVGDAVAVTVYGCYSDYIVVRDSQCLPVPANMPEILPLLVSGLTASLALDEVGQISKGDTVLVTAAAGGTGVFAVQLAKTMGCHVIGTCSSDAKCEFLRSIGCDRAINYKTENFRDVMRTEYPKGVDVVYESVGGDFFDICVDALAVKGRLIVIGFISGYSSGEGWIEDGKQQKGKTPLPVKLLAKSASVRGFFLNAYTRQWPAHVQKLATMMNDGKLKSIVDQQQFNGLESVNDAIDHLHSGKNMGKVYVNIHKPVASSRL